MNVVFLSPGFPAEMPLFTRGLAQVGARVLGVGDQPLQALPEECQKHLTAYARADLNDEEAVLRTFFRNGRLTEVPAKESKRRIVLERIALEFEPGVRYEEKEVNVVVGRFYNDHASLRRYLVDEGFLDREGGIYWRAGGRVDV